jgi:hypothetical protein
MTAGRIPGHTPEERALARKRSELATLEAAVVQREWEVATQQAALRAFEVPYLRLVGARYAALDALEAQSAAAQARLNPADDQGQAQARHAHAHARASAQAIGEAQEPHQLSTFEPSECLKQLYRDVAKRLHPALTTEEREKGHRTQRFAPAVDAYERGDKARLQAILRAWKSRPEAVKGDGRGAALIRAIRKIAQVEEWLRVLEAMLAAWKASPLLQLHAQVDEAKTAGRDLLAELAAQVEQAIEAARERLPAWTLQGQGHE